MSTRFPQGQDGVVLRDIHLPAAPSWWPPAPGWWIVLAVFCSVAIAAYFLYRRTRQKHAERARIVAEIQLLSARYVDDDAAFAAALHQLLRRVVRRYAEGSHLLQGEPWRLVLARVPVDAPTLDALMTLEARMYQPHADFDRVDVQAAAYRWLNTALHHKKIAVGEAKHA